MEPDGIAIVGIAAQLPSGTSAPVDLDYASFWDFLITGRNASEPLENILPDFAKPTSKVKLPAQGAFLKNATCFDNISLGVSTKDARVMPYSARRLLDLSFQALLDSGINSRGCPIGCFMTGNSGLPGQNIDTDGSFAYGQYALANRISYALDLTGPSIYLDTACSSSLTALHLAMGAIERGDCTAALVGAAQINRFLLDWTSLVQGGVLASDGICRPLDALAAGYGRGEGAIVIVLKPLKDAIRDHDHVYSVVLGSAISATGSRMPLSVPNGISQQYCIQEAYKKSGFNPSDVDYVELHATGTPVGDPIEVNTAGQIFSSDGPAVFGSVKGNIGHLESAAFLASLVKASLIFEHGIIPPAVNFSKPADTIKWDAFNITIPIEPTPLGCRSSSGRSIISISGFGVGGATGHAVLQAPPVLAPGQTMTEVSTAPILFLVGGLSSSAVDQIANNVLRIGIDNSSTLRECAATLSRRARQLPWRKYFTFPIFAHTTIAPAALIPHQSFPLAFVFSGQGPQHFEMGRQLFAEYPVFRNTIIAMDDVYRRIRGVSLIESTGLFALGGSQSIAPTNAFQDLGWPVTVTLSAITMIQLALFDLLKSIGVLPEMMLGHSAGETATLYASGAGPKEMAMEISIARGEAMALTESPDVGMVMLATNAGRVSELISRVTATDVGVLEIACFNSPESTSVSGSATLIDQLITLAGNEGILARHIRTTIPAHSSLMDSIKTNYRDRMDGIFARYPGSHTPRIPVFSTCRAEQLVESFTASYFWDNCRNAVLFSKATSDSLASSPIFLEISCHAVLSSSILAHGVPVNRVLCPMRRISATKSPTASATEPEVFLDTLGRLSLLGFNSLDLSGLYGPSIFKSKLIDHPLAVRAILPPKSLSPRETGVSAGPLSFPNLQISATSHPELAEHVINGEPILPVAGFIELLLESGANFLWDVEFISILSLASKSALEVSLRRLDTSWSVTTSMGSFNREHARGFMQSSTPNGPPPAIDCENIFRRLPVLDFDTFYQSLEPTLAAFGPRYRRVVRGHGGASELIVEIKGPTPDELSDGYCLHPVIADACMHVVLHTDVSKQYSKDIIYVLSKLEHFVFYHRKCGPGNWFSHIKLRQWTPDSRYYDVLITDSSGAALCELRNMMFRKFTSATPIRIERRFDLVFQPVAVTTTVPILPTCFAERTDNLEIQLIHGTLDTLALAMISKSLDRDIIIGEDESRHRYLNFARQALKKRKDVRLSPEIQPNLQDKWPYYFEVTSRIAAVHELVFTQCQHAMNALRSDDIMATFYSKDFYQMSDVCIEATKVFSGVLALLRQSGKKSIRVLEVGAGTGYLTHHLIDELKQNPDLLVEYTITDISYAFAANLARTVAYDGLIIPKAYNINKDPNTQGIPSDYYDVVVSLHVLHASLEVKATLVSFLNLLVPGGSLLTVELDGTSWADNPGSVWYDCIFGSFSEWFGLVDGRDHCAMSPTRWKELLAAVGFTNTQICVESGTGGRDFFFLAQKSLSPSIPASDPPRNIYSYEAGQEIELQRRLRDLDIAESVTIYLLAMHGPDADTALGLCAVLRREMPLWSIRLAVFESLIDFSNPTSLLIRHMPTFNAGEDVVSFDRDGGAHVLRVVLSPAPSSAQQLSTVSDDPNYISLRVTHWAGMSGLYDGFVGHVASSNHPDVSPGDFFGGVVEASSTELLHVHVNSIISTTKYPDADLAPKLLGTVLTSLITWPGSGTDTRLAIAIEDENLAQLIAQHTLNISGIHLILADFRDPRVSERLDILISDSTTYAQYPHLPRWIPRSGKVFLWDQLLKAAISTDPSYIRRTLANDFHTASEITPLAATSVLRNAVGQPARASAAPPFRNDRAYVLLGGIGGLGIDLAVWMYQRGARHVVLTSRRGMESLDPLRDAMTLAKVEYLRRQNDLNLRLERCDATDTNQMRALLRSLSIPIAGCFHMTLVLSDAAFFQQTHNTFRDVWRSKLRVFEIFSAEVEIESLDFFVALSSVSGLLGLYGLSNYASACTALDGLLARYTNAFSLIAPGIVDAGHLDRTTVKYLKEVHSNISAEELWGFLEDALRKLDDAPFNQYIPDLNWRSVELDITLPMSCRHLIVPASKDPTENTSRSCQQNGENILIQLLELLEVTLADFNVEQPLTVFGLDSISAAKLSAILRPYTTAFSQMRLLGGATWSDIESQLHPAQPEVGGEEIPLDVQPLLDSPPAPTEQPIVEICSGSGIPLIILPGGNGSVGLFLGFRRHFQGALWAVQATESTPLDSLEALVGFWKRQICAKRPHGPYRFAVYSSSSLLGVALTKSMEDAGEQVVQLTFIDHSPTLWIREDWEALLRELTVAEFLDMGHKSVLRMLHSDPTTGAEAAATYQAVLDGSADAPPTRRFQAEITVAMQTLLFNFLLQFYPKQSEKSYDTFIGPFEIWLFSAKAPMGIIVAEHGIVRSMLDGTSDLGASRFAKPVQVHHISGVGHFGLFRDERVAQILNQ